MDSAEGDCLLPAGDEVQEDAVTQGEVDSWKNVMEFKTRRLQGQGSSPRDSGNGKDASGWEIVDCSHASECGSTARSIPGSEFGLSDSTGDGSHVKLEQEFEETHARAVAEIEACEAAGEGSVIEGIAASMSTLLPISTGVHDANSCATHTHSGVSDVDSVVAVTPGVCSSPDLAIGTFGSDEGLDSTGMVDKDHIHGADRIDLDGYSTSDDIVDLGSSRVKSEPDSHEVLVEPRDLSREGSVDGKEWSEVASDKVEANNLADEADSAAEEQQNEHSVGCWPVSSPTAQWGSDDQLAVQGTLAKNAATGSAHAKEEDGKVARSKPRWSLLGEIASWLHNGIVSAFQRYGRLVWNALPGMSVCGYYRQVRFAMYRIDWARVANGAGIALLSTLVVGLLIENRRMGQEVKTKQEEVAKLMVALMNFQELWSSHRAAKLPILRHTNFAHLSSHP